MAQLFTNNAATTLAAAITTTGQTSITVQTGKGALFPNPTSPDFALLTLDDGTNIEIVKLTARSTDTLTIVRAQESTTAQASFAATTTKVELRFTAGTIGGLITRAPIEQTVANPATVTPTASQDIVTVTGQGQALTIANPTGTPSQGQKLVIRVKDNGAARAITFGSYYRALGNALPTTTIINKTTYMGFLYNSTDTKWDLVALAQEA